MGTDTLTYLHADHLQTARLATDQSQAIVWRWEGSAFGDTPAEELSTVTVNLRFPGQYYDQETGLHYNWNRYYDPATGRYITSDPIGFAGGINPYGYVTSNPLRFIDPLGLAIMGRWDGNRAASVMGTIDRIELLDFGVRLITASVSIAEVFVSGTGVATGGIICTETDDCSGEVLRPC